MNLVAAAETLGSGTINAAADLSMKGVGNILRAPGVITEATTLGGEAVSELSGHLLYRGLGAVLTYMRNGHEPSPGDGSGDVL